ncbi:MAG: Immunoglobulin I-set domain protein [Pedosphaera sp.]|nr:Immunoglobulin I-set domain protein [Pedosphaera sp.]
MKKLLLPALLFLFVSIVSSVNSQAQSVYSLSPLTAFGTRGDGTIQTGDTTNLTTGNFQRGHSYDPLNSTVVLIDRQAGGGGTNAITGFIQVLDATTGAFTNSLNTNGMSGGNFADMAVAVADDGAVYVGNLVNDKLSNFKLYRWDSTLSASAPLVVWNGVPGGTNYNVRWGDTMDIRGAGTNTQIIVGSRTFGTVLGTNVAVFTTADGTNFTPHVLNTDSSSENYGDGIAFGTGNTFWAKTAGKPLCYMSFNLSTSNAITLKVFDATNLPEISNLATLAVDNSRNLLAALDIVSGTDHVRLYDISNPNNPLLLDVKDYVQNNANATAAPAFMDFGGGNLYTHIINNGLYTFNLALGAAASPTILVQPVATKRVAVGQTVSLEVLAYPGLTYQWQKNGSNVSGATNAVLTFNSVQSSNAGTYVVIVGNASATVTSTSSQLIVVNPQDLFHLNPLWSITAVSGNSGIVNFGGGGNTPNQRTIAYNSISNQLIIVSRANSSSANFTINVMDGNTGQFLYRLNTNGLNTTVGIGVVGIAAAADGAIYACNADTSASVPTQFRIYRWANTDSNTVPVLIYGPAEPSGQNTHYRWGDTFDVRGSGMSTQILIDNQDKGAPFAAILSPTDSTMTNWTTSFYFLAQNYQLSGGGSGTIAIIGRSLQFGLGDTLWQKRTNNPVVQSSFDLAAPNNFTTTLGVYTNFTNYKDLGPVGLDFTHNLMGALHFVTANDTLDLFDISDINTPLLLASYNFPMSPRQANNNGIGQVIFSGNKVFALDGNNGILAFTIASGPITPPLITQQPQSQRIMVSSNATFTTSTADLSTYQWQFNGTNISGATVASYAVNNAQLANSGSYRVIASNSSGSTTSSVATLTMVAPADVYTLSQAWAAIVGVDPNLTLSDANTPFNRSLAYYAPSNQLYVINRTGAIAGLSVNVYDGSSGAFLYQLNTTGIAPVNGANIILVQIAVGADGAIYAGNASVTSGTVLATYNLYRWADSNPNTVPVLVYSGEPGNSAVTLRWGDSMDVRGAGTNTQVIIDEGGCLRGAILTPTDATMSAFTNVTFTEGYGAGSIGRSLQFTSTNSFWEKRKGLPLTLSSYDLNAGTATTLATYNNFPATLGGVTLDTTRNLAVGVDYTGTTNTPDVVSLFEISNLNLPLFIARYNFPTNHQGNANFLGQCVFAGSKVFALNGNNGLVAFNIVAPASAVPPQLTVALDFPNVTITWPTNFTGYTLEGTPVLGNPSTWSSVGTGSVAGTNYTVINNASSGIKYYRLRKP